MDRDTYRIRREIENENWHCKESKGDIIMSSASNWVRLEYTSDGSTHYYNEKRNLAVVDNSDGSCFIYRKAEFNSGMIIVFEIILYWVLFLLYLGGNDSVLSLAVAVFIVARGLQLLMYKPKVKLEKNIFYYQVRISNLITGLHRSGTRIVVISFCAIIGFIVILVGVVFINATKR